MYMIVIPTLGVLLCIQTLVGHVMCQKRLITSAFRSFELFGVLRASGHMGAIPT